MKHSQTKTKPKRFGKCALGVWYVDLLFVLSVL